MSSNIKIDRHYLFLHGVSLAIFAERILRNTAQNPNISKPTTLWEDLSETCRSLRATLADSSLRRKRRTEAIREQEARLLSKLEKMAEHVERITAFKSDALSAGFHLHNDHSDKPDTRRKQRMTTKMARLSLSF